jgi:hypothetical protein
MPDPAGIWAALRLLDLSRPCLLFDFAVVHRKNERCSLVLRRQSDSGMTWFVAFCSPMRDHCLVFRELRSRSNFFRKTEAGHAENAYPISTVIHKRLVGSSDATGSCSGKPAHIQNNRASRRSGAPAQQCPHFSAQLELPIAGDVERFLLRRQASHRRGWWPLQRSQAKLFAL